MPFQKIRLVSDSTCDLPQEVLRKLEISIVPGYVNIEGQDYRDNGQNLRHEDHEMGREEFYRRLSGFSPLPATAAPAPGLAREVIDRALEGAEHVIILTVPRKLSAYYEACRLGAAHLEEGRATLIDSGTVSMALGYQVQLAAEVARETGDLQATLAAIRKAPAAIHLQVVLNTLENLRRSGRINLAQAGLGTLLQLKPMLTVSEGEVRVLSRVRTFRKARRELAQALRGQAPIERLTILHSNNMTDAQELRASVADIAPRDVHITNVNPVLGTHIGPGALGFVTLGAGWRE